MADLHADAGASLRSWTPPDADQAALRERFVRLLDRVPDAMLRSAFPEHLTAGTLVVEETGDRVLLNLHRKARRWFAFGGHAEPGDPTLASVALREAREESGLEELAFHPEPLQLDVHPVAFCDPRGSVNHLDVRYGARAPRGVEQVVSEESLDVRWWSVRDLPDLEPSMLRLIDQVRARLC
ncbi:NUDIX hydrolase [Nocardioides sambongensis]|uniref:NUDIX hydrolase n=1 Tax=Nocardioides sambongensis TaxID=2589074 RepID=UPI00112DA8B5|nr:NUDIX domain-containing protein [Nocardioides sambongensis]